MKLEIKLIAADGAPIGRISPQRLSRIQALGLVASVRMNAQGEPKSAKLFPRDGESVLEGLQMKAYSFQERIDIYRVWKLMDISRKDRPVFQMSVTDNLVYVDPSTGQKRTAA
ncbi:MAG: hypothetical protein M3R47_17720 [Chloroflexota bacterium]|nr:hypothetical protein [Chloroflexota bacterium]